MLNTNYLERSIPDYTRTELLAQKIRFDLGNYVAKRNYLSKYEIARKLKLMGYGQHIAWELACYIEDCIESAFKRGVFVVSSRITTRKDDVMAVREPKDLIARFKEQEPEYFDPMKWYLLRDFENDLRNKSFHDDIIRELAGFALRHVRVAFSKGMQGAASKIIH